MYRTRGPTHFELPTSPGLYWYQGVSSKPPCHLVAAGRPLVYTSQLCYHQDLTSYSVQLPPRLGAWRRFAGRLRTVHLPRKFPANT